MDNKRTLGEGTAMLVDAMERRRHPRFLFSASMTVRLKDGIPFPGISEDMSASGLSAMVSGARSEGDTVILEPVAGAPALARVRHKVGRLYGFEFVDLSVEQTMQIERKCLGLARTRRRAKGA